MGIQLTYRQILEYIIFGIKNGRYQEAINIAQDCIDALDKQEKKGGENIMISERGLKRYRRIALQIKEIIHTQLGTAAADSKLLADFVLELTQELLERRLEEEGRKNESKA